MHSPGGGKSHTQPQMPIRNLPATSPAKAPAGLQTEKEGYQVLSPQTSVGTDFSKLSFHCSCLLLPELHNALLQWQKGTDPTTAADVHSTQPPPRARGPAVAPRQPRILPNTAPRSTPIVLTGSFLRLLKSKLGEHTCADAPSTGNGRK